VNVIAEKDLQQAVIETGRLFGWRVAHFRPARTNRGWVTPVAADGKGFPDLVLVNDRTGRLIFAELKSLTGRVTVEQQQWLDGLRMVAAACDEVEVHVWTTADWEAGVVETTLRGEQWRTIKSHPAYEVSDHGRVRRQTSGRGAIPGRVLRYRPSTKGYARAALHDENGRHDVLVHVLVLTTFVGPRPTPNHQVNHRDGDKSNNHVSNLEWATPKENNQHAWDTGLQKPRPGTLNGRARLTEADVQAIRASTEADRKIAPRYGVSRSLIGQIRRRETWKDLA
jgi:hypothetical protein